MAYLAETGAVVEDFVDQALVDGLAVTDFAVLGGPGFGADSCGFTLAHPVSIPDYGTASVTHSLFDSDVLPARSQIAPSRGFNRITIANEDGASGSTSDRIEYVPDENDANQGKVRAYLTTARPVLLTHTGHAATVIEDLGEITRTEMETVEFIEGRARLRYPVTALVSTHWQHADLGSVTVDGENLVAAIPGYSLALITYTTTSFDWCVALPIDEKVHFVLVDA